MRTLCHQICECLCTVSSGWLKPQKQRSDRIDNRSGSTHCEIKVLDVTNRAAGLFGNKIQESWGMPLVHLVFVELFGRKNLHVNAKYCCERMGVSQATVRCQSTKAAAAGGGGKVCVCVCVCVWGGRRDG